MYGCDARNMNQKLNVVLEWLNYKYIIDVVLVDTTVGHLDCYIFSDGFVEEETWSLLTTKDIRIYMIKHYTKLIAFK